MSTSPAPRLGSSAKTALLADHLCKKLKGRLTKTGWKMRCPAHEDHASSLSLQVTEKGNLVIHCDAGCSWQDVVASMRALGIWPESKAAADPEQGKPVAAYEYRDPATAGLLGVKERFEFEENGQITKTCRWLGPDGKPGLRGSIPSLYHAEVLAGAPPDVPVELVEGEKCVHAMESIGLLAVCTPHGANSPTEARWKSTYADLFRGRVVRLWPDNDAPGRAHMEAAARALRRVARQIKVVTLPDLPDKGDIVDFLNAGHTREEVLAIAESAPVWRTPGTWDVASLLAEEIPPLRWSIPGLLPEGLVVFGGKPKMGKSRAALQISVSVAAGGTALGAVAVDPGEVLYLALEDSARRLQDRVRELMTMGPPPPGLYLRTQCPKLDAGGLDVIEEWLSEHTAARLVVVDTFKKVRPRQGARSAYDEDYEALDPLGELARRWRVTVLVIHHLRKALADDPLDMLNGSSGLAAVADGLWIMQRRRGHSDAVLHVVHREGEERELALAWEEGGICRLLGDAEDHRGGELRRAIRALLAEEPMTPQAIAEALDKDRNVVRQTLHRMRNDGELVRLSTGYTTPQRAAQQLTV